MNNNPTASLSEIATIENSLIEVSEKHGDITQHVYKSYFARCPGSEELMLLIEDRVRGRMLDEVYRLLLEEKLDSQAQYLGFETKTHVSYGVEPEMYQNLFTAIRDTIKDLLNTDWNKDYEQAWKLRIELLLKHINGALV